MISILTPTYNRKEKLEKLYYSILNNKRNDIDFDWYIMDDGSNDNTKELINNWIIDGNINIHYYYQDNQGKMVALNNLVKKVESDLIVVVDSDDLLVKDAIKIINDYYLRIKDNNNIYGLLFKKSFLDKEDYTLPKAGKVVRLFNLYMKSKFKGDTCIVFKTEVRKKYKHKLENNERFVTEARMYNEIDKDYEGLLVVNESIQICEYLNDGYTKNINKLFINNPYGYQKYYKECLSMKALMLPTNRLYLVKHYILFSYLIDQNIFITLKETNGIINRILVFFLVIPGYILSKKRYS